MTGGSVDVGERQPATRSADKHRRGDHGRPQALLVADGCLGNVLRAHDFIREAVDLFFSSQLLSGSNSSPRVVASISAASSSA